MTIAPPVRYSPDVDPVSDDEHDIKPRFRRRVRLTGRRARHPIKSGRIG